MGSAVSKTPVPHRGKKKKSAEEFVANRLHPVQVEYTYPLGARIDMERDLPLTLEDEDPEDVLDLLSSPPEYEQRLSPVSCSLDSDTITGINPADVQVKFLRKLASRLRKVAREIDFASRSMFGEGGPVSFMGLGLDPDTISRLIETDYDTADNAYSRLMALIDEGFITPVATVPFHILMPTLSHEFEIRLMVRIGMEFYWPMVAKYNKAVAKHHGQKTFVMVFWLPEGGYNARVLEVLHHEFSKRCEAEGIKESHLVLLLDTEQSKEREQDLLMKRWNTLRPSPTTRDVMSIIYKERTFTDWMTQGHPSTKKQLDRTIAKVDAVLRDRGIDHLWSHFEPVVTLLSTFKTCYNFEQKILKLTELKYQPCGPDVFVRRKLAGVYGMGDDEPRRTSLRDNTCWNAYPDTPGSLVRFLGYEEQTGGFTTKRVLGKERPYNQVMPDGTHKKRGGNPIWKPALMASLQAVHRAVVGDPKTFMGGMLELVRDILPYRRVPVQKANIEDFLVMMARVAWKEHFIHHVCSEADIQVGEMALNTLLKDAPDDGDADLSEEDCVVAAMAAHAIYHSYMGLNSTAFAAENLDTRAVYDNVVMMTLAVVHAITAYNWREEPEKAAELFQVFKTELVEFENALERHGLDKEFGIDKKLWRKTIASEVPQESELNVVARAAKRLGAKHLRTMGFRNEFDRRDVAISTSTGHIWSIDIEHLNYKWENTAFCGLPEE